MNTRILQVVTPLHVGDGHALGAVDLPIARERHTLWPTVPGSGIKGALRAWNVRKGTDDAVLTEAFGLKSEEAPSAGRLCFSPATLLAMPVRSLVGGFALLSCPLALARLQRNHPDAPPLPKPSADGARLPKDPPGLLPETAQSGAGQLVLEDLCWSAHADEAVDRWVEWLGLWLGDEAPLRHLTVVHDEVFSYAARAWTEARTRASIDPGTQVVAQGKLFSVEMLPAESLLWTTLSARRRPLEDFAPLLPQPGEIFPLGGQRSVGLGRVAWYTRSTP